MSNPTPVVVLDDSLAAFLARVNQFSEANSTLIQQKFNKAPGATGVPGFPSSDSNTRTVAQWLNMFDDFLLAYMDEQKNPGKLTKITGSTADAVPTSIGDAITVVPDGSHVVIETTIFGKFAANDFVVVRITARAENDSGAIQLDIDTKTKEISTGGTLGAADADLIIAGTDIEVQVTGIAVTAINWEAHTRLIVGFAP